MGHPERPTNYRKVNYHEGYTSEQLLQACSADDYHNLIKYPFVVAGIDTSVYSLAKGGWRLRIKWGKYEHNRRCRLVFYNGKNTFTFRVSYDFAARSDLRQILSYLSCHYYQSKVLEFHIGADMLGEITTQEAEPISLETYSDMELLMELERRADLRPKKRKKPVPNPVPDNVVHISERVQRVLSRGEDYKQAM